MLDSRLPSIWRNSPILNESKQAIATSDLLNLVKHFFSEARAKPSSTCESKTMLLLLQAFQGLGGKRLMNVHTHGAVNW